MKDDNVLIPGMLYQGGHQQSVPALFGAPRSLPHESPCSWIQRLCATRGFSFTRLQKVLGFAPDNFDWDKLSQSSLWKSIVEGVGGEDLPCEQARLGIQRLTWSKWGHWVLDSTIRGPGYRWCPVCFSHDLVPYLRWFWRYEDIEHCPFHHVPLRRQCPTCDEPVMLNRTLLISFAGKLCVPNLAHCGTCGTWLGGHTAPGCRPLLHGSFTSSDLIHSRIHMDGLWERDLTGEQFNFAAQEWQQERARDLLMRYQTPLEIRLFDPFAVGVTQGTPRSQISKQRSSPIRKPATHVPLRSSDFDSWMRVARFRPTPADPNLARPDLLVKRVRVRWNSGLLGNSRAKLAEALAVIRKEKNMYRTRRYALAPDLQPDKERPSDAQTD